jgi:GTPase
MSSRPPVPARRRAFLVGLATGGRPLAEADEHLDELAALADTAGADTVGRACQARAAPDPKTFIGRGKAEAIAAALPGLAADLVVVDDELSGGQAKNLEAIFEREVLDRSGLILEIFERRARSAEARTQVALARARYELPRLTRRWGHLSRQAGGIGVRGGEGETQLEADRRMLRRRIARLERDLVKIEKMRRVQRASRGGVAVVALAGYTNAGKSTLFNRLTADGTLAEDRLFATLDSRLRRGRLPGLEKPVVFADTVGFIRKLPHHLVASFRSTLEEAVAADLVVHVVDRSHPQWLEQREVAEEVLAELGVESGRIVTVLNKVDLLSGPIPIAGDELVISAATGEGVDRLGRRLAGLLRLRRRDLGAAGAGVGAEAPEDGEEAVRDAVASLSLPRAIE